MYTRLLKLILLICAVSWSGVSRANQVTNPYFTGTNTAATSWTSSAAGIGAAFNHPLSAANPTITAAGGSTEFYSGCVGAACLTNPFASGTTSGAQQTVPTTIGQNYTISFWTYFSTAANSTVEIDVYWGTTKIYAGTNVATAGWSQHTVTLGIAATSGSVLTVAIRDDPSYSAITYIDIEPVGPVLNISKASSAICDTIDGNSSPKKIPGADIQYAITLTYTGVGSATLTSLTDTLPATLNFDPMLNSGAAPATNCVITNTSNSLSSTGFAMHSGTGAGPGVTPPGTAADAVTAGASISGQAITINFATLATAGVAAPNAATLAAGSYITLYYNAFIK